MQARIRIDLLEAGIDHAGEIPDHRGRCRPSPIKNATALPAARRPGFFNQAKVS